MTGSLMLKIAGRMPSLAISLEGFHLPQMKVAISRASVQPEPPISA